ncbi:MAG TPA: PRC-barrel domain-containing protein [Pseudonocardiaceae bacterium]
MLGGGMMPGILEEEAAMPEDVWQFRENMAFSARSVDLGGYEVVGPDGTLGTVDKVSNDVRVNYIVLDTGEWLSGRQVIVPAYTVTRIDPSGRKVIIDRTKDDIRNAPEFRPDQRRTASFQDALTGYYHGMYDTGL